MVVAAIADCDCGNELPAVISTSYSPSVKSDLMVSMPISSSVCMSRSYIFISISFISLGSIDANCVPLAMRIILG